MDASCLDYCLSEEERLEFEKNGFFAVDEVLPLQLVEKLIEAVDRADAQSRREKGLGRHDSNLLLDFIGKDDLFLELLDWPEVFPKVWGILGWHIQLYHSHIVTLPPAAPSARNSKRRLGWHQDTGRLNIELEGNPRPRVSLKVAYFLTDTTALDRGNFTVVPGSHLRNELEMPADETADPAGATPICVKPGSAVFFDRRLWHSAGINFSEVTRKVLFYGYSYRWLKPRDDMSVAHYMDRCDPIRRQLLGASSGGMGFTSPAEEDVPLREWIRQHLGKEAVMP